MVLALKIRVLRSSLCLCVLAGSAFGQASIWVGGAFTGSFTEPRNWYGAGVPVDGGTAVIQVGSSSLNEHIDLPSTFSLHQILVANSSVFELRGAPGGSTITLGSGGIAPRDSTGSYLRLRIGSGVTLNLTGATTFDFGGYGSGSLAMSGVIAGTGPLTLATGAFLLNRPSGGNTYTGGTFIGTPTSGTDPGTGFVSAPIVTVWNNSPFGTGPVSIQNGASLYAYAPSNPGLGSVIPNAFTLNASGSSVVGTTVFRAADTKLEFSGPVTLAGDVVLQANSMQSNYRADEGYLPIPGPAIRNPIVFSGGMAETGGIRSATFSGLGLFYLSGTSSWTGGTFVGNRGSGSVVFGSSAAIPSTGTITLSSPGYVGVTDPDWLSTLVGKLAPNPTGAIGLDTPLGASAVTNLASGTIDLNTLFPGNAGIRLGTATQAVIGSGASIINVSNNPHRFGNGGGTLYVQAPLSGAVGLALAGPGSPLRLFLQGANTYTGTTTVSNGQLVFDSALPGSGQNIVLNNIAAYAGVTENSGATPAQFLARIASPGQTTGTIGFDTAPTGTDRTTPASTPRTVSESVDLSTFSSNTYLGTATSAILSGIITPATADSTYRFTAARGGRLEVSSTLGSSIGSSSVVVGLPGGPEPASNGRVVLSGFNYQTLTTLQGNSITLESSSYGLGTGALSIAPGAGLSTPVGFSATDPNSNFSNSLIFQQSIDSATPNNSRYAGILALTGSNPFFWGGNIVGPIPDNTNSYNGGRIVIQDTANPNVTFAGDNSGFYGVVQLVHGSLTLGSTTAAGNARFVVDSTNATLNVTQSNTLRHLEVGTGANLRLADGITLTIDTTNAEDDRRFDISGTIGGTINGNPTSITSAALRVTGSTGVANSSLFIANASGHGGGTTIDGAGSVGLGNNFSLGSGAVTLNAPEGGLILAPGVTFSNALTYSQGALAGAGRFAASTISSYDFSSGRGVMPGFPDVGDIVPGVLTLAGDAVFGNGGFMAWSVQDAALANGSSKLFVEGALSLTATSGLFSLNLLSFDEFGHEGGLALNFNSSNPYTWNLVTASGGITGFDPTRFTIDTSLFGNSLGIGSFYLTQSGNDLLLNFTPVPEPSTYALIGLGLGAVAFAARRRRRA